MKKIRVTAVLFVILGLVLGYFVSASESVRPFRLGLDLSGGSYVVYRADVSQFDGNDVEIKNAMAALRDVLERRVGFLGISGAQVQTETNVFADAGNEHQVVVELPGITDLDQAIALLGQTPLLEFKLANPDYTPSAEDLGIQLTTEDGSTIDVNDGGAADVPASEPFLDTGLTGQYLKRASLQFGQGNGASVAAVGQPIVALEFTKEGAELFADITTEHTGEILAIFLDGQPISTPVINDPITNGEAVITGQFDAEEAKQLVGRLNSGALPVPIQLLTTETIGPSLGTVAVDRGITAGLYGLIFVAAFLILWYRLPGLLASLALAMYAVVMLVLFKTIPVTLTAAGIVGFVISLGMAVDANILIFERVKEEMRAGQTIYDALIVGFQRAWPSIRDANISSLISAAILFWFGTSLIRGFALTFGLGVLVSMITAITVTRYFLAAAAGRMTTKTKQLLFGTGFSK